jgi:FMN-dependent NADH-azoreductase
MKILIVKYLPSGATSNTKKVLDLFLSEVKNHEVQTLDLLKDPAPIFDEESMQAYYKRNYGGQKLDEKEAKLLAKNDKLIAQLKAADLLVMAAPMHNFGIPAAMKAYMDAVIFKGETFEPGKKLMAGKKAVMLYTSGGIYSEDKFDLNYPNWNSIALNAKVNFSFMGFDDSQVIGTSLRENSEEKLTHLKKEIQKVVEKFSS